MLSGDSHKLSDAATARDVAGFAHHVLGCVCLAIAYGLDWLKKELGK